MKTRDSEAAPSPQSEKEGARILNLTKPVKWGKGDDEETISKLEFGDLTVGDMEDLQTPFAVGDYMRMASRSTGVPYPVFMKMNPTDGLLIMKLMESFFDIGLLTGSS